MATINNRALILGCFTSKNGLLLTKSASNFNDKLKGEISDKLKSTDFDGKLKQTRIFYNLIKEYQIIVITGLGRDDACYNSIEEIDLKLENIRNGIIKAIKVCDEYNISSFVVDDCSEPKCVGEICSLSNYDMRQWKSKDKIQLKSFNIISDNDIDKEQFNTGLIIGEAQVLAAKLAEKPANLKYPTKIAELIISSMPSNVNCIVRDKSWIIDKKMNMFLSVNQGSILPPVLLEAHYKGSNSLPIILVGKGITFDSGGISIKPSAGMAEMKADMMGASVVFSTIRACALLKLPLHIIGLAPFTENLPSGSATKPGDVFESMCGKTVEVDNTDAEGRLVLGDTLTYAESFNPQKIIDLATLTGAVGVALGSAASAIYTRSENILKDFKKASSITGDRVWHMPLYRDYSKMIESKVADIVNCTKKREAGSCTAAAFLSEFVQTNEWAHIDIAGVMITDKDLTPYSPGGMSGRPTRTLIEYLRLQQK